MQIPGCSFYLPVSMSRDATEIIHSVFQAPQNATTTTQQHPATHRNRTTATELWRHVNHFMKRVSDDNTLKRFAITRFRQCKTMQRSATHCTTPQHRWAEKRTCCNLGYKRKKERKKRRKKERHCVCRPIGQIFCDITKETVCTSH